MDNVRHKLKLFIEEVKQLPILNKHLTDEEREPVEFVLSCFERYLNNEVDSLDAAFSGEHRKARRGRQPNLEKHRMVAEALTYRASSDESRPPVTLVVKKRIANELKVSDKFVSHVWDLISESFTKPPEELLSRRGLPITREAWGAVVQGCADGISRSISESQDEYLKALAAQRMRDLDTVQKVEVDA